MGQPLPDEAREVFQRRGAQRLDLVEVLVVQHDAHVLDRVAALGFVDGFDGASGNLILTLNQTIGNDNFADCQFIGGVSGVAYGSDAGATKEPGEPDHAGNSGGESIWYCWTAPINGAATFDTIGSTFNTLLAVYTGDSVSNLTLVAANDDIDPANGNLQSRLTFNAAALALYHIAIDGYNADSGDSTLNWNLVADATSSVALASVRNIAAIVERGGPKLNYRFLEEGELQLTITGRPVQRYRVELSCDLVHWTPSAATLTDALGLGYFTDKTTMHSNQRMTFNDPVCGPAQIAGASVSASKARFYRVIALAPSSQ